MPDKCSENRRSSGRCALMERHQKAQESCHIYSIQQAEEVGLLKIMELGGRLANWCWRGRGGGGPGGVCRRQPQAAVAMEGGESCD